MTKPDLKLVRGSKIEVIEAPERIDFTCWKCGRPCVTYPRGGSATQHSLPTCAEWQKIEAKKDDVERFLIKSGLHISTPPRERG